MPHNEIHPLVILGVAASDCHAVANKVIAHTLRAEGFLVMNLGVCTPLEEFAETYGRHPNAVAVVIGSVNGHAYRDLSRLPAIRAHGGLSCPVVLGGNLKLGADPTEGDVARLRSLGVDHIVDIEELVPLLNRLAVVAPVTVP